MSSGVEAREPQSRKATVTVVYNGRAAAIEYEPHQAVQALLRHALREFGIAGEQEMALFTLGGAELPEHTSVEASGVSPGDELVLRQRVVRGGS